MNNNEYKVPVYDLSGKVAIVTGATKGLGYGIAMKLAAAGAKVVITSRHQDECDAVAQEIKELGGEACGIKTDVQVVSEIQNLVDQTVEKYGTEGIFGKDIYILENSYEMGDFYARTFFKTYDPKKKAEGTTVYFANELSEIPAADVRSGKALVLMEVPEENAYKDITAEFPL